jgi:hypothetical protein
MRSTGRASLDWSGRPSGGGSNNVHTIRAMCAHALSSDTWPVRYEIVVRGLLSETLLAAFPTLSAEAQGAETVLAGALADQAALYGVLAQIEALGIELIEVRRMHS